jgi:hypothetical protein
MITDRLLGELKRLGFIGSIAYYVPRVVSRISRGRCKIFPIAFYAQPVGTMRLVREEANTGVTVAPLSPTTLSEATFGRPEGVIAERFLSGQICIAAVKDTVLMGFIWISTGALKERLVRCEFEPFPIGAVAWDYDIYIVPRYRLGRTFARLWDGAREYMRQRGFKASVSWIELSNVGSIRAHLRIGARRVGWAVFVTAWDAQVTFCSVPPFFHWSSPGGRPARLRVDADLASL